MTIDIDATYRDGALHPDTPLNLPNNTPVRVRVAPVPTAIPASTEEIIALRPTSPRFSAKELDALLDRFSISAPSLPEDFSRADIYSDHD